MALTLPLPDPDDPALPQNQPQVNVGDAPPVAVDPVAQRRVLMSLQPPDPMQDPGFRAYVAKQAQAQAELKAAQQQTAATRGSTGFRVGNALMSFGGASPDEMRARYEQAGQPVADVLQRQQAGLAGTKGAQEETALAGTMRQQSLAAAAQDPNSPISRRVQSFWKPVLGDQAQFLTAADVAEAEKAGTLSIQKLHYLTMQRQADAHMGLERDKLAEEKRWHDMSVNKDLPPATVNELESNLAAVKALDDLKAQKASSGTFDKLLSKVGLGDFDQTKNAVAAEVAKADAKGRANPTGALREKQMLPGAFQGDAGIDQKRKQLLDLAEQKLNVLAAGRVRPEQVAEYRRQLDSLKAGSAPDQEPSADSMVDVVSPEGTPGQVPAGKLKAAIAKGFKRAGK